ncbi:MAG: BtrH N-terminal domain-containing protein [Myxococcota bacterium]|nr:BtrH N-terminal domain-containing protein [Myxococcota bacterium]
MTGDKPYEHRVASHCESGSVRNLLLHAGLDISEAAIFGIGSGPAFYYLFFAKGPSGFPLVGVRNRPGMILKNVARRLDIGFTFKKHRTTQEALAQANACLDAGEPVIACVDMFYMKYLPPFLRVHAPFHFIVLCGRDGDTYTVSDPYFKSLAQLDLQDLTVAWSTFAPMAQDNFLCRLERLPKSVEWKRAIKVATVKTCKEMVLPPVVRDLLPFVGVQGMRTYSKAMTEWPRRYRGVKLREGILMSAVGFEDQGTGGGAFRLMYGAYLDEAAHRLASPALKELAAQMTSHGQAWRETSRKLIRVGKLVPMQEERFDHWALSDQPALVAQGLEEIAGDFRRAADFEQGFFQKLGSAVRAL